jgi:hypothetical protein
VNKGKKKGQAPTGPGPSSVLPSYTLHSSDALVKRVMNLAVGGDFIDGIISNCVAAALTIDNVLEPIVCEDKVAASATMDLFASGSCALGSCFSRLSVGNNAVRARTPEVQVDTASTRQRVMSALAKQGVASRTGVHLILAATEVDRVLALAPNVHPQQRDRGYLGYRTGATQTSEEHVFRTLGQ